MKWVTCSALCWIAWAGMACSEPEPNKLDNLNLTDVKIGEHNFRAWVADSPEEREAGLMRITSEQMAPLSDGTERGMIFVFPSESSGGFWMKNTIIPLDIAFIRTDGTIVTIHTMAPETQRTYYPKSPYRYALEVRANTFSKRKIKTGDHVQIPDSLLKTAR